MGGNTEVWNKTGIFCALKASCVLIFEFEVHFSPFIYFYFLYLFTVHSFNFYVFTLSRFVLRGRSKRFHSLKLLSKSVKLRCSIFSFLFNHVIGSEYCFSVL